MTAQKEKFTELSTFRLVNPLGISRATASADNMNAFNMSEEFKERKYMISSILSYNYDDPKKPQDLSVNVYRTNRKNFEPPVQKVRPSKPRVDRGTPMLALSGTSKVEVSGISATSCRSY